MSPKKITKQPKKEAAKKKANGYEQPKPIPVGTILTDQSKQAWRIGKSIGCGGFGEIYSATKAESSLKNVDDYPFVVKIVSLLLMTMEFCFDFLHLFFFRSHTETVRFLLKCIFTCEMPN
jgi:hypothetical protein